MINRTQLRVIQYSVSVIGDKKKITIVIVNHIDRNELVELFFFMNQSVLKPQVHVFFFIFCGVCFRFNFFLIKINFNFF